MFIRYFILLLNKVLGIVFLFYIDFFNLVYLENYKGNKVFWFLIWILVMIILFYLFVEILVKFKLRKIFYFFVLMFFKRLSN